MGLERSSKIGIKDWLRSGEPMIWMNAAAVAISAIAVVGLIVLLAVRGLSHFWPDDILSASYTNPKTGQLSRLMGELVESEEVSLAQLKAAGFELDTNEPFVERYLLKMGNRDITGVDFAWFLRLQTQTVSYPRAAVAIERREWGNFYGFMKALYQDGKLQAEFGDEEESGGDSWEKFSQAMERSNALHEKIKDIQKGEIGSINYRLEKLRLRQRSVELNKNIPAAKRAIIEVEIEAQRKVLNGEYEALQEEMNALFKEVKRDHIRVASANGKEIDILLEHIVRAYRPNAMSFWEKLAMYFVKLGEFLTDDPREANTEGGIFPAIFGTVMMVVLMAVLVTPFGVVAAVYLREYAKQGPVTRIVRIAVNNLAGVPSIVYGIFGLGFFIYFIGSNIDEMFFKAALPAPTFGTPGLMWASLTLALLTLPVVIVATEEGLARIPRSVREGSLALGATKAETLWRVILPMSSPAMMTGLILAVARAAGEVAPLMLVGVVKLAPSLPLDGNYPFLHLERKFMHLGFHIYDVGFQSPNVEAARPLVYATALLLVVVIAVLNFSAVAIRNSLRERYKSLEH